jgi:hypothetical protein
MHVFNYNPALHFVKQLTNCITRVTWSRDLISTDFLINSVTPPLGYSTLYNLEILKTCLYNAVASLKKN